MCKKINTTNGALIMSNEEYDDFEIAVTIDVYNAENGNLENQFRSGVLDDKTIHEIIEQIATARRHLNE